MRRIFLLLALSTLSVASFAQKKPLDHTVYDDWQSTRNTNLSDKGTYAVFQIEPQEGDGKLNIYNLKNNKNKVIDRAYNAAITPDEKFVIGRIKATFAQSKENKKKKSSKSKTLNDSLFVVQLPQFKLENLGKIKSYKKGKDANKYFAYMPDSIIYNTDSVKLYNPLIVQELGTAWKDTINNVDQYVFNNNGNYLVVSTKPAKKDTINTKKELYFFNLDTKNKRVISTGFYEYKTPKFDDNGKQLVYLAAKDSVLPTNRNYNLFYYTEESESPKTLIDTEYTTGLPNNWHFTTNSTINFSQNGERIYSSIAPLTLPQDTITDGEEVSALDIWHYKDYAVQPSQLKNKNRELNRTYETVINLDNPSKMMLLSSNPLESISTMNRGDGKYALAFDRAPYSIAQQWSVSTGTDIYLINLTTGERELLFKEFIGSTRISPNGKFLLLYKKEDLNWYSFNLDTKESINLTGSLDVNFWDESNDMPSEPYPYGVAGWTVNDNEVLIYDNFDIWKFDVSGKNKAICVTGQAGRANKLSYRILNTDPEKRYFEKNDKLLLSVFNNTSKDEALATIRINESKKPINYTKEDAFQLKVLAKAKENETFIFSKSNFATTPDVWVTKNYWKTSKQLSHINPQMKDYNWGTAELVSWNAYDGKKIEGLLYKPEDFDASKKYPMMIYFYETHSDDLNQHYMPQPSWSIINISFYVSRGYIVFCPDIHYTAGLPGESAYNCIVSGAEAMAKNSWVDKENMAIQGQSWGGYQVAYLITRTNMFKAAGSGAPVSNMTSAYGGIRWSTGTSRQLQYEMGQSRIGGTLWDCPELYIANSPIFKADRIETPLLIMHNDNDGAVPWYQGVELFMGMRRLQKPVWLLQYNHEEHNLIKRVNRKDLSIRLQQFLDHYLKGDPIPVWMDEGLPATRKGKTMGYELK